jgi:hypothetical protein
MWMQAAAAAILWTACNQFILFITLNHSHKTNNGICLDVHIIRAKALATCIGDWILVFANQFNVNVCKCGR